MKKKIVSRYEKHNTNEMPETSTPSTDLCQYLPGLEDDKCILIKPRCQQSGGTGRTVDPHYEGVNKSSTDGSDMSENAAPMSSLPNQSVQAAS